MKISTRGRYALRMMLDLAENQGSGVVALKDIAARPDGIDFQLGNAAPARLFDLLPAAYTGAVDEIKRELDELVGLAPVKEYVFGLADNIQVQQRRAAAGRKTASLSMHMIFTGNPGTGTDQRTGSNTGSPADSGAGGNTGSDSRTDPGAGEQNG